MTGKIALADSIAIAYASDTLQLPGSFDYPFDPLSNMGKITSQDQKIRIYTWNLPCNDGTNTYYGFLQYKTGQKTISVLFNLTTQACDNQQILAWPSLPPDNWYGMPDL